VPTAHLDFDILDRSPLGLWDDGVNDKVGNREVGSKEEKTEPPIWFLRGRKADEMTKIDVQFVASPIEQVEEAASVSTNSGVMRKGMGPRPMAKA